jgi:hypothetical protein
MVNCYKNTRALQIDSCFPINFLPVTVKRESLQLIFDKWSIVLSGHFSFVPMVTVEENNLTVH